MNIGKSLKEKKLTKFVMLALSCSVDREMQPQALPCKGNRIIMNNALVQTDRRNYVVAYLRFKQRKHLSTNLNCKPFAYIDLHKNNLAKYSAERVRATKFT